MTKRSLCDPGSPSAPLPTTKGSPPSARTLCHLRPAGNHPPPRPRSPEARTDSVKERFGGVMEEGIIVGPSFHGALSYGRIGAERRTSPARREGPSLEEKTMISITAAAAQKVKGILEQEKANVPQGGLRIY